jgi:GT2 family glycosyltransferase
MIHRFEGLAVCIVNWNTADLLVECVEHLIAEGLWQDQIWVLDNASSDDSIKRLRSAFPAVVLLESPVNLGFAKGVNQLLETCGGERVLLLNTDVQVERGAVTALNNYLGAHPDLAAVGPLILEPGGATYCHDTFPTLVTELAWLLGLRRLPKHATARKDVDWIGGAALMLSQAAVRDVGLLDETFFMYAEEMDWCRRARSKGWRIACLPSARVAHLVGASGGVLRRAQLYRSKIVYQGRYGRSPAALLLSLVFFAAAVVGVLISVPVVFRGTHGMRSHWEAARASWSSFLSIGHPDRWPINS